MPRRKEPFTNGDIYHIFNKSLDHQKIFSDKRTLFHFELSLWFYRFTHIPFPLSRYLNLSTTNKANAHNAMVNSKKRTNVLAYCIMPNHYHLLVEQIDDQGISGYIGDAQNSLVKYYNTRKRRHGPLFQNQFKAVRIETEAQLVHTSRYIHLNPLTANLVADIDSLVKYPWSSLPEYLGDSRKIHHFTDTDLILSLFESRQHHLQFVKDNAEYQQQLHIIKHIMQE